MYWCGFASFPAPVGWQPPSVGVTAIQDFAERFYKSKAWMKTRAAFVSYRRGLCERCLARGEYNPGIIVHHKVHLTPDNINDPSVTLNFDNLSLLCRKCHGEMHSNKEGSRFNFDSDGRIIF